MHPLLRSRSDDPERVIVVDDDEAFRIRASMFLRKAGYRAASAANGEEALGLLLSGERTPALILLDLAMPIMDGWRFREIQKAHSKLWHIPIVALADAPLSDDYRAELKPSGVLVKPFDCGELMKAVTSALTARPAPQWA